MNSLSIFSPSFADTIFEALDKNFAPEMNVYTGRKGTKFNMPRVDIRELDSAYLMEADLPGFSEEEIDISLKDRIMTLSSIHSEEKTEEKEDDEKETYIMKERSARQFIRKFSLPDDIEEEDVSAAFKNGVLTVNIPKRAERKAKKIEINKA